MPSRTLHEASILLSKKGQIEGLPSPDYYQKPNPIEQIDDQVKNYKSELSKFILLSSFSYFEAYVVDVMKELVEFHGGFEAMTARSERAARNIIDRQKENFSRQKIILSKKEHRDRKWNAFRELVDARFVFPTSLLSSLGVKSLIQKLGSLKSVDIPKLMIDGFHMSWSEQDLTRYHGIRDQRNKIAHGDVVVLIIKDVFQMNTHLRSLAQKIDRHLIEHFFISEEFM